MTRGFSNGVFTLPFPPHLLQIHPACQEDSLHCGTRFYYGHVPTGLGWFLGLAASRGFSKCHVFLISGVVKELFGILPK